MAGMQRHQANRPRVVDETVDGEALVMDMVTGSYYGCEGASALAWLLLSEGASIDELAATLVARFSIAPAAAASDGEAFLAELLRHELLVPRPASRLPADDPAAGYDGAFESYATLQVEAFTDLADLILLDPVHDVSEAGWPHKRE
jgi:Coenzyme PQQ synthesis protein D (PqqD)